MQFPDFMANVANGKQLFVVLRRNFWPGIHGKKLFRSNYIILTTTLLFEGKWRDLMHRQKESSLIHTWCWPSNCFFFRKWFDLSLLRWNSTARTLGCDSLMEITEIISLPLEDGRGFCAPRTNMPSSRQRRHQREIVPSLCGVLYAR